MHVLLKSVASWVYLLAVVNAHRCATLYVVWVVAGPHNLVLRFGYEAIIHRHVVWV